MPVILGGRRIRTTKKPRKIPPSGGMWHFAVLEWTPGIDLGLCPEI